MPRIVAAGVLCHDVERNRVLLVHRTYDGFWSVPGGLTERGELIEDTAVREFFEETRVLLHPDTLYFAGDNPTLSSTSVMRIFYAETPEFHPKINEEHDNAVWFYVPLLLQEAPEDLYPGMHKIIEEVCCS